MKRKILMKHIDRIAYVIAGTVITGGILAFSPISGELDPPEGPVADTTPSLADISSQIAGLAAGANSPFPPNLQSVFHSYGGNQNTVTQEFVSATEADFVRIYAIVVTASVTNMLVGESEQVILVAGGSATINGNLTGTTHIELGGLRVPTPVRFRTGGQDSGTKLTLLYWVE